VTDSVACGSLCLQYNCTLFCLQDGGCELYSARVSWHYTGMGATPSTSVCYSSWGSTNDAAHTATITTTNASSPNNTGNTAVNGFYCFDVPHFCYHSIQSSQPWWVAVLTTSRQVTSVRIQTRRQPIGTSRFQDVEVRVGHDTQNLSNNKLLGFYNGLALPGEVVIFRAIPYITGTVVSLQSTVFGYLCVCDVQVLYT
ncbi:hypothetical protein OTU49_009330, partial [Cherax quadricarinatus]